MHVFGSTDITSINNIWQKRRDKLHQIDLRCFRYEHKADINTVHVKERWSTPRKLKTALHIHRDAMVNTDEHLDRIEKWLGVQIQVCGDVERLPKINAKTSVHLVLKENHYTLLPPKPTSLKKSARAR